MKLLWVNSNFMHPTTKGGQIRTLEMLRYLHRWHEIHYVALENPDQPEGSARAHEYSARSYPFPHRAPDKRSPAFARQLLAGAFSSEPISVSRHHPPGMKKFLEDLIRREKFEAAVVDHLAPMSYFPDRAHCVLFEHNVEFMIWRRNVQQAANPLRRAYFKLEAQRVFEFECRACRQAGHVVACSEVDKKLMQESFGIAHVSAVPTGVNLEFFAPPPALPGLTSKFAPGRASDLVFIGSMDWLPNQDGVLWFVREILPLIRRQRPETRLAVVGRTPPPTIEALALDPGITVTGTVPDVRPWFWESAVSVVPLRIGGGTRLKIYEAMAARNAVVSTTIGAEGLEYNHPANIRIADTPDDFAAQCVDLLDHPGARQRMTEAALEMVRERFSWDAAARRFDEILQAAPRLR
jgi:polysaccharide biosynthesis protein PslH